MNNPNTTDFKQTWINEYQLTHYKAPVYKAITDESFASDLDYGQTLHRTFSSDLVVENMGGDGGYNNQAWTDTDETLTVNYVQDTSFFIKKLDKLQYQLDVQAKYARKAMNALFLQMDATVLGVAYQGAGNFVDDGSIGGTSGNSITLSVGNVMSVFAASDQALRLSNVIYEPAAQFSGDFRFDAMTVMPNACVSAQLYNILTQYLGGKTTQLGDNVSNSGYTGKYFGFNLFVTNNLPWTGQLVLSVNPIDGDTMTFLYNVTNVIGGTPVSQAITFTFRTTPTVAGDVVIGTTATDTVNNLVAALNAPYTLIPNTATTGYIPFVSSSLTTTQIKFFFNLSANNTTSATTLFVQANGQGNVPVSQSMTSGTDVWTATQQTQHNIFGTNKSISLVLQYGPDLEILQSNPAAGSNNSGRVGWDFVTWLTYGVKVFNDQAPMLVDVRIRTDAFTTAPVNTFN